MLFAIAAADTLSTLIIVGTEFDWSPSISLQSCRTHLASFVASKRTIYSDSALDRATVLCRLLSQLMEVPVLRNATPVVECRSSLSSPQLASEWPTDLLEIYGIQVHNLLFPLDF